MFERRLYHHIDWALLIAILALCALGVVMINSTTADPTRATSRMYITQLYVIFRGQVQMGARRWIPLKFFNLQPSEFAKVGIALVLAKFYGENRGTPSWGDLAVG